VADTAYTTVYDWVSNNGTKYFDCTVTETQVCCDKCETFNLRNGCKYCFPGGDCFRPWDRQHSNATRVTGVLARDGSPPDRGQVNFLLMNVTEPCPPDTSQRGIGTDANEPTIYWAFAPDRTDPFYADLLSDTGISRDDITLGTCERGNGCAPSAKADDYCWGSGFDHNLPQPAGYSVSDVANPKDIVVHALENASDLQDQLVEAYKDPKAFCYYDDPSELVDAVSLPVLMISDAVDAMQSVEVTADNITAEKRKNIINAILSALLMLLPIGGEITVLQPVLYEPP